MEINDTPSDYQNPDWESAGGAFDWKNYITEELEQMWSSFTDEQKAAIARCAWINATTEIRDDR